MKKLHLMLLIGLLIAATVITATTPLRAEETGTGKLIALTFDDGPGQYTNELLDALAERDVKATFFLVGSCVKKYPDIVKREYEEGHQLANHSWDHAKLTTLSQTALMEELNNTNDAIKAACGTDIGQIMLRPPYGSFNNSIRAWANTPLILWSVDPLDWKYRNADTVKNNILKEAKDGAIILVHDIHATSVPGAIAAIDELQKQGYTFVTVSELFRRRGITMENGVSYTSAPANGIDLGPLDPYDYNESKLQEHWAYEYINYVKKHNLMVGISDAKFGPNYPMTRAMLATVLYRLSGESGKGMKCPFTDVAKDQWYSEAIAWAAANGIVSGIGNHRFAPESYVTREQAAVMITNYIFNIGIRTHKDNRIAFTDAKEISRWAQDAINILANKGLMTGLGDGSFSPKGTMTRAQTATILTKIHQLQITLPALSLHFAPLEIRGVKK